MKKFIILVVASIFAVVGYSQADAISSYFDKYVDDERFSMVYISPKMFEMLSRMEIDVDELDDDVLEILDELKGLRILSLEDDSVADEVYQEARGIIDMDKYEELLVARDEGQNVHIMVNGEGDYVNELLVLVGGDDEFTLLSFVGNIDLKKVGQLSKMLDIDGAEHLEKLEDKN